MGKTGIGKVVRERTGRNGRGGLGTARARSGRDRKAVRRVVRQMGVEKLAPKAQKFLTRSLHLISAVISLIF